MKRAIVLELGCKQKMCKGCVLDSSLNLVCPIFHTVREERKGGIMRLEQCIRAEEEYFDLLYHRGEGWA